MKSTRFETTLGFVLLCSGGCTNPASEPSLCELAREHASECLPGDVIGYERTECDEAFAARILQTDCAALQNGKDDDFLSGPLCTLGFADQCEYPRLLPEPQGAPTQYPILLVHGFAASPDFVGFARTIVESLERDGHTVYQAELPPFASVATRTNALARRVTAVLEQSGASRLHLIAHSMGGLDSRYLLCHGVTDDGGDDMASLHRDYSEVIATVTTISTPHRGTYAADVVLERDPPAPLLNAFARVFGSVYSDAATDPDVRAALRDLSEAHAPIFNEACPDDADVSYFAYAGVSSVLGINAQEEEERAVCETSLRHEGTAAKTHLLLDVVAAVVAHGLELRPNDEVVAVESAKWGEFLGCIPADHALEVAGLGEGPFVGRTGFDVNDFYRKHAFFLATQEAR